jgi:hypothetical protein
VACPQHAARPFERLVSSVRALGWLAWALPLGLIPTRSRPAESSSDPLVRAFCSTAGRFRTRPGMGVTRFGTLSTRGTSCDRREVVLRSPACTRRSTDRHPVVVRVRLVSAETHAGCVFEGLLCSHRGYRFCEPKVFSNEPTFFAPRSSVRIRAIRRPLRGARVRPSFSTTIHGEAQPSNGLKRSTGKTLVIQESATKCMEEQRQAT